VRKIDCKNIKIIPDFLVLSSRDELSNFIYRFILASDVTQKGAKVAYPEV